MVTIKVTKDISLLILIMPGPVVPKQKYLSNSAVKCRLGNDNCTQEQAAISILRWR